MKDFIIEGSVLRAFGRVEQESSGLRVVLVKWQKTKAFRIQVFYPIHIYYVYISFHISIYAEHIIVLSL